MDHFERISKFSFPKQAGTAWVAFCRTVAIVLALVGLHFLLLALEHGNVESDELPAYLFTWALALGSFALAALSWSRSKPQYREKVRTEIQFLGADILIAYHDIDRHDGRGVHSEELQLNPQNIVKINWDAPGGVNDHGTLRIEHSESGQAAPAVEEWELKFSGDKRKGENANGDVDRTLFDRLVRYAKEHLGNEQCSGLLGGARGMQTEEAKWAQLQGRLVDPGYSQDAVSMVELEQDAAKRRQLMLPYLAAIAVVAAVGALALALFEALDAGSRGSFQLRTGLEGTGLALLMLGVPASIIAALVHYHNIKKQRISIGPDRLLYQVPRQLYYTDTSSAPFSIKKIERYEPKRSKIILHGFFLNTYHDSDDGSNRLRTSHTKTLDIWRVFEHEDELLRLLDRLSAGWQDKTLVEHIAESKELVIEE